MRHGAGAARPAPDVCGCSGEGNQINCSTSGLRYCAPDEVCHAPANATYPFGEWGSLCSNPLKAHVVGVRPSASRLLIPSLLVFTYKCDLLANHSCARGKYTAGNEEVMRLNMWNTIQLHGGEECSSYTSNTDYGECPASTCLSCSARRKSGQPSPANVTVHFYDDAACQRVIEKEAPTPLLRRFQAEALGMYKADICRGAALKRGGGLYFDLDLKARMDSRTLISNTSTFVSCVEGKEQPTASKPRDFFQAFIAVTPKHPIIEEYLQAMVEWYEETELELSSSSMYFPDSSPPLAGPPSRVALRQLRAMHERWMGTESMGTAFRSVLAKKAREDVKVQIWHEVPLADLGDIGVPSQGGDLCDYVVFDPLSGEVPFYSRAQGATDYCSGDDTRLVGSTQRS